MSVENEGRQCLLYVLYSSTFRITHDIFPSITPTALVFLIIQLQVHGRGMHKHSALCDILYKRLRHTLKPNTHRRRRRDSTVELSRVGGVYWIRN